MLEPFVILCMKCQITTRVIKTNLMLSQWAILSVYFDESIDGITFCNFR